MTKESLHAGNEAKMCDALHGLRCCYGGCVDTMTSLIYKEGELVERKD